MGERTGDGMKSGRKVKSADVDIEVTSTTGQLDETEAARLEIERTRAHMGETLDHIGERLAPERFKEQAVEAAHTIKEDAIDTASHLKEAAVEAARQVTGEVIGGVKNATREVVDKARSRVRHTKHEIEDVTMPYVDTIRRNPVPAAMVGLGLYWLIQSFEENKRLHRRRRHLRLNYGHSETPSYNPYRLESSTGYTSDRVSNPAYNLNQPTYERERYSDTERLGDRAGEAMSHAKERISATGERLRSGAQDLTGNIQESTSRLKEKAARRIGHYSEAVSETAHQARDQFETVLYENPLIVAAAAGAIGLVVGMLLPDTEIENETMGYKRDRLVSDAQEVITEKAADLKEKAVEIKDKAMNVARETAAVAGQTLKNEAAKEGLTDDVPVEPAPTTTITTVSSTTIPGTGLGSSSTMMP